MKRLFAILALLVASQAHAGYFYTGKEILDLMNDPETAFGAMLFVAGVVDSGEKDTHCLPPNMTLAAITNGVKLNFEKPENQRFLSLSAYGLISTILNKNFPCKPERQDKQLQQSPIML